MTTSDDDSSRTGGASPRPPASRSLFTSRWRGPLALAILFLAIDQFSKYWIDSRWEIGRWQTVIPHFFDLVHLRNTGAAWGMFRGQTVLLAVLSLLVMAGLWWKFDALVEGWRERGIAMGLVLGGIVGNLIDRLARGSVVDFLLFYYRSFQWPAFNVADTCICCGVGLFILSSLFRDHDGRTP